MSGNNTERNLANLEAGQEQQIHLLVQSVEKATARNGSVYEKLKIRDTEGHDAILFNWNEPFSQPLPATITARVQTELYRETNSYKMLSYQKDNSIPTDDFLPKPKIDVKQYWRELNDFAKTLPAGLHALVGKVLMADQKRFVYLPLTTSKSFARRCGILEATLKLTQMAATSAPIMGLDRNITVTSHLASRFRQRSRQGYRRSCIGKRIPIKCFLIRKITAFRQMIFFRSLRSMSNSTGEN